MKKVVIALAFVVVLLLALTVPALAAPPAGAPPGAAVDGLGIAADKVGSSVPVGSEVPDLPPQAAGGTRGSRRTAGGGPPCIRCVFTCRPRYSFTERTSAEAKQSI